MPTEVTEAQIDAALAVIVKARDEAASPLVFTDQAKTASDERSKGQFRASLPDIKGGFATVQDGLVKASRLFGQLAKQIALFENPEAQQISVSQMEIARGAAEEACKLRIAGIAKKPVESVGTAEGLVC
jgi:hypothetical protein